MLIGLFRQILTFHFTGFRPACHTVLHSSSFFLTVVLTFLFFRSHHDSFVPPTPMIVSSIEALNCTMANVDVLGIIPDILEIIGSEMFFCFFSTLFKGLKHKVTIYNISHFLHPISNRHFILHSDLWKRL